MAQIVKVLSIGSVTPDVLRIVAEKPADLVFKPGQAVDVSINKAGWENQLRPFTFTSQPEDAIIEFTIKTYPSHNGVTQQILLLAVGDELLIHEVFGDISYKGEGVFIAGGVGVTPFIAILNHLRAESKIGNNKLLFANKTKADIIQEEKFKELLGDNFINILSDEERAGYEHGYISPELLKKQITGSHQYFYICGPVPMMEAVEKHLSFLGVTEAFIVTESF